MVARPCPADGGVFGVCGGTVGVREVLFEGRGLREGKGGVALRGARGKRKRVW